MKKILINIVVTGIILLALVSLVGAIFNRPVIFAYVYSDSMEPTISRYDAFIINPLARDYQVGDIIVFKAGDEWICHRIVGVIGGGYITKGDANVATDQMGGGRIVEEEDIAGKVVEFMDSPVLLKEAGKYLSLSGVEKKILISAILFITGMYLMAIGESNLRTKKKREKRFIKVRFLQIYAIFALIVVTGLTFTMVSSFDREVIQYGTTSAAGLRPEWVAPGAVFERSFQVGNKALYPVYVILNTEKTRNLELNSPSGFFLKSEESKDVEVTIYAPDDTRLYVEEITVYRYLPLVPPAVLDRLASTHEYLPVLVVDLVVLAGLFLAYGVAGRDEIYRWRLAGLIRIKRRMRKQFMSILRWSG